MKNGERMSTARAFMQAARRRPNLSVATDALVDRVLIENGRIAAVQYRRVNKINTIKVRREAWLSRRSVRCKPAVQGIAR